MTDEVLKKANELKEKIKYNEEFAYYITHTEAQIFVKKKGRKKGFFLVHRRYIEEREELSPIQYLLTKAGFRKNKIICNKYDCIELSKELVDLLDNELYLEREKLKQQYKELTTTE